MAPAALLAICCAVSALAEDEISRVLPGGATPLAVDDANVTRAAETALAAMNKRVNHYCPRQGVFETATVSTATYEVASDELAFELEMILDGNYPTTASVVLREDSRKMVFMGSVPYCCSVRSADLANRADLVEKHNADPTRTYDQAVYKQFQGHTYASLARKHLGLLRRPIPTAAEDAAGGDARWALEKGRTNSVPSSYDFREELPGCEQPVRDQGNCGSCWAQSNTGMFEDRLCKASGGALRVRLSTQQHVSCDLLCLPRPDNDLCQLGCDGGFQDLAGEYLESTGLIEDRVLPYTAGGGGSYEDHFDTDADAGACPNTLLAQHTHWRAEAGSTRQVRRSEAQIMAELSSGGPLDVAMVVFNDFWNYKKGVYQSNPRSGEAGGHAIKMIGYGVDRGVAYWTCQNSWGKGWGENGYFRAKRGDAIGLEYSVWAITPVVPNAAVVDETRAPAAKDDDSGSGGRRRRRRRGASAASGAGEEDADEYVDFHYDDDHETGEKRSVSVYLSQPALSVASLGPPAAAVVGYVVLINDSDGSEALRVPIREKEGRLKIDRSKLAPGVYRLELCEADGVTCEAQDDKLHVTRCPTDGGLECGGRGACVVHGAGSKAAGQCACMPGFSGPTCRPSCADAPELVPGCAVRGGVWDTHLVARSASALYKLSVPRGGCRLQLSTCHRSTTLDTTLSVFPADTCPYQFEKATRPEPLLFNDDASCSLPGAHTAAVLAEDLDHGEYLVLVEGSDAHNLGDFELSAMCLGAGAGGGGAQHGRASHAQCPTQALSAPLASGGECVGTTGSIAVGASVHATVGPSTGHLYALRVEQDMELEVSTCGSEADTEVAVYRGCPEEGGHLLGSSDDECGTGSLVVARVAKGADYFIRVQGFQGEVGRYTLSVAEAQDLCGPSATQGAKPLVTLVNLPSKDDLDAAGRDRREVEVVLEGNTCAEPSILPPHDSPDAVFQILLPVPADLDVTSCTAEGGGTDFATVLHLASECYYARNATELVTIGLNQLEPSCDVGERGAAFYDSIDAGRYTLVVTGANGACGHFRLRLGITPAPPLALAHADDQEDQRDAQPAPSGGGGGEDTSRAGCTCMAVWEWKGKEYHGCDKKQPHAHSGWCPVTEAGCGLELHAYQKRQHPTSTGWWDWCDGYQNLQAETMGAPVGARPHTRAARSPTKPALALAGAVAAVGLVTALRTARIYKVKTSRRSETETTASDSVLGMM